MGELNYEVIDEYSPEFEKLSRGDFGQWYEDNYKLEGLHSFTRGKDRYLLLSAGEKPTAGYFLEDLVLVATEKEIEVKARLHVPGEGEIVAQVITYPHILVRILEDGRQLVFGGIEEYTAEERQVKTDSGRYVGQIDSNFIEISISGVPEEIAPRVFRLEEKIKETFETLELKTGDEIIFKYFSDKNDQLVIVELSKFKG